MHSNKVQGFIDEVVAQSLEQALHQRHAEAIHTRPTCRVLGLSGETLLRDTDILDYYVMFYYICINKQSHVICKAD